MESIYEVEVRDLNGKRRRLKGTGYDIVKILSEGGTLTEDEIMWVSVNGSVVWCALGSSEPVTAEDLVGFMA